MALASAYRTLTLEQLRERLAIVTAMAESDARTQELAILRAEIARRTTSATSTLAGAVAGASTTASATGSGILHDATEPLREVSSTAMWTAIGIGAAVIGVLAIAFAIVHASNRV